MIGLPTLVGNLKSMKYHSSHEGRGGGQNPPTATQADMLAPIESCLDLTALELQC